MGNELRNPNSTSILDQITNAVAQGSSHVKIEPGEYRLSAPDDKSPHLSLVNLRNIAISAYGVKLICGSPNTAIDIINCQDIEITGLCIDYDPLPFTQATIIGFAPDRTYTDVRIHKGYAAPKQYDPSKTSEKQAFCWTYDHKTRLLKPGALNRFIESMMPLGSDAYRLSHGSTQFRDEAAIGDYIRIPQPFNRPTGVNIFNCRDLVLRNVTLHSAPTHFGFCSRFCHNLTFDKVRVVRGPIPQNADVPRLCSTVGDGMNFGGITGMLRVINCECYSTGDDGIAVYSEDALVLGVGKDKSMSVCYSSPGCPPPPNQSYIAIYTRTGIKKAMVLSSEPSHINSSQIMAIRARACQQPYASCLLTAAYNLTLDRSILADEGDLVKFVPSVDPQYIIRSNRITNAGSRGIVANQSHGIIQGNKVYHTYLPGIHMFAEFRSHGCSPTQSDVVIFNNQLSECCRLWPGNDGWLGTICIANWEADATGFGDHQDGRHNNIRIAGNSINKSWGVGIQLHYVKGVEVRRNSIVMPVRCKVAYGSPRAVDNSALIYIDDSEDVRVQNNSCGACCTNNGNKKVVCSKSQHIELHGAFTDESY